MKSMSNNNTKIQEGDTVRFQGVRKQVIGIHHNNNLIIKMYGKLVQVVREDVSLIKSNAKK